MTTTNEMYQHLTEAHGLQKYVCLHCWNREIEVYQDGWEGCYDCWCTECEPKISPPPED